MNSDVVIDSLEIKYRHHQKQTSKWSVSNFSELALVKLYKVGYQ